MGWWKDRETGAMIGDRPLDLLGEAVGAVVEEYKSSFGRYPTKEEWESLLFTVLGNPMPEYRAVDGSEVVKSVSVEFAIPDAE